MLDKTLDIWDFRAILEKGKALNPLRFKASEMTLYTVIAQQIFCLKIVIVRKTIQFQRVAKCHNDSPVLQLRNSTIIFALQFSQKFQGSYSEYAFPQDFCEANVPSHTDSEFPK